MKLLIKIAVVIAILYFAIMKFFPWLATKWNGWEPGFLSKFIGLILICVGIGGFILFVISIFEKKDLWASLFGMNAANRWAKIFVLELATIYIIACFNWGPALWLPEKHPTPEQRSSVAEELKYLWRGTNVLVSKETPLEILDPQKPLLGRNRSWFWWVSSFILTPVCFVFLCWAYSDDVIRIAEKRREEKRKQKETNKLESEHKHEHAKSEEDEHHFWKPDFWDIISIGETIARLAKDWKRKL